jgi:hypothetical protein
MRINGAWCGVVVLLLAPLWSCQTAPTASTYRLELPAARPATFDFTDTRPSEQRVTGITGDPFGTIITLGDNAIQPSGVDVFKALLADRLGAQLEGQSVRLEQFAVQIFLPHSVRNAKIESLIASGDMNPFGAFFTHLEAVFTDPAQLGLGPAQKKSLVGTRISGRIGGHEFFMRHDEGFGKISEGDVHTVIAKAIDGAISDIAGVAELRSNSAVETDTRKNSARGSQ